jgi:tetratricopeptide (TPR) repeat protein
METNRKRGGESEFFQYGNETTIPVSVRRIKREKWSAGDRSIDSSATATSISAGIMETTAVEEIGASTIHRNVSLALTPNPILPPQRQQYVPYDEGMYLYSSTDHNDRLYSITTDNNHNSSIPATAADEWHDYCMNLGRSYIAAGDYGAAIACGHVVLERLDAATAPLAYHVTYHTMGYCWYRLGELNRAATVYQRSLRIAQQTPLAQIHGAAARNALAVLRLLDPSISMSSTKDDDNKEEEDIPTTLQNCYDIYVRQFGANSKEAATIQNNLARSLFLSGRFQEALQSFEPCLQVRSFWLGFRSLDVTVTICNIGQTYNRLGQLDRALEHYHMFVHLCQQNFSNNHRDVATIVTYMADIYYRRGDLCQAKCYYEQSLEIRAAVGGSGAKDQWDDICAILIQLGDILKQQKSYDEALNVYTKLCHIQSHVHGTDSCQVIGTLSCIGLIYYQQGDLRMAFQNYIEVLQKQMILYSFADHSDIASTLNFIGLILFHQEVYQHAKSCFCESLRMKLSLLGPHHHEIAVLWYNIASVYLGQGDHETAIAYYKEAVRIECERQRWEQDHPTPTKDGASSAASEEHSPSSSIVRSLQKLGAIYNENGDFEEALKYYTQALNLELKKRAGARNDRIIGKLINIIGNIHLQCANIDKMMKCYIQASRIYRRLNENHRISFTISGYGFYYLSRMYPSCAAVA